MTTLYLTYEEDQKQIPSNREDYNESAVSVAFHSLTRERPDNGGFFTSHHSLDVPPQVFNHPDYVYLVVVRYSDGGTFGHTTGYWHVSLVTTDRDEALKMETAIRANTLPKEGVYKPWEGYFSSLEDVEIHGFKISDTVAGGRIHFHG